ACTRSGRRRHSRSSRKSSASSRTKWLRLQRHSSAGRKPYASSSATCSLKKGPRSPPPRGRGGRIVTGESDAAARLKAAKLEDFFEVRVDGNTVAIKGGTGPMIHHERLRLPPHDCPADQWNVIE